MFPLGMAGAGLFVLRVLVVTTLFLPVSMQETQANSTWFLVSFVIPAIFIALRLFTPCFSAFCMLKQSLLFLHHGNGDAFSLSVNMMGSLSLALLGPGAYSIDAIIFGRRRLIWPTRR